MPESQICVLVLKEKYIYLEVSINSRYVNHFCTNLVFKKLLKPFDRTLDDCGIGIAEFRAKTDSLSPYRLIALFYIGIPDSGITIPIEFIPFKGISHFAHVKR